MVIKAKIKVFEKLCKDFLEKYAKGQDYNCGITYENNECPVLKKLNNECPIIDIYDEDNLER